MKEKWWTILKISWITIEYKTYNTSQQIKDGTRDGRCYYIRRVTICDASKTSNDTQITDFVTDCVSFPRYFSLFNWRINVYTYVFFIKSSCLSLIVLIPISVWGCEFQNFLSRICKITSLFMMYLFIHLLSLLCYPCVWYVEV